MGTGKKHPAGNSHKHPKLTRKRVAAYAAQVLQHALHHQGCHHEHRAHGSHSPSGRLLQRLLTLGHRHRSLALPSKQAPLAATAAAPYSTSHDPLRPIFIKEPTHTMGRLLNCDSKKLLMILELEKNTKLGTR